MRRVPIHAVDYRRRASGDDRYPPGGAGPRNPPGCWRCPADRLRWCCGPAEGHVAVPVMCPSTAYAPATASHSTPRAAHRDVRMSAMSPQTTPRPCEGHR